MGIMETKQAKWEELSISNDFLFGKVMQNPKLCKELLLRILPDLNIERIEYPELQKSISMDMDARSVRLDVYPLQPVETPGASRSTDYSDDRELGWVNHLNGDQRADIVALWATSLLWYYIRRHRY